MKTIDQTQLQSSAQAIADALSLIDVAQDRVADNARTHNLLSFAGRILSGALFDLEQFVAE